MSSSESAQSAQLYNAEEERVGVPVKGGLYEVDLVRRHCFPVYWSGENGRVLRGHWFARKGGLDWLPLREDVAEQLEVAYRGQVWHRRRFQPSGLFAARVDLQGSTPGLHALFVGEDDTWEAWLHVDPSGFSSVIPLGGNGVKLRRGYSKSDSPKPTQDELRQQKEEEMHDYCSQVPVRHLVFMVHGIGQRLEKSNLVDDVGNFRHITASLAELHLTSHQRSTQRVLYIPCQWRKGLKLSGESAVEKITLDGVRGFRVMLSATVHDVLYYMSPIYCQDIINSVSNQLNRLYLKFLKRNPGYNGKVSIYGHSLGSVLSYDILCHQENLSSPFPMEWMYNEQPKDEKPSSNMNDQASICDSENNLGDKGSSEIGQIEGMVSHDDDGKRNAQATLFVHDEDGSEQTNGDASAVASPVTSDFDEFTTRVIDPKQPGDEEDVRESVSNSNEKVPCEGDSLDKATSINGGVTNDDLGNMAEEDFEDITDKDKMIHLLQKEVNSLGVKIAELESQCGDGDSSRKVHQEKKEVLSAMIKDPISEQLPPEEDDSSKSYTPYIRYTKLEFKVDTFFAVGSPLGVFLALRNIRIGIGKGQEYWAEEKINEEMPACRQMFNIFHPFDPVAYRIEPLVCKEYISKRPVIVPYHKGGKRLYIGFQEFTEDLAARSQAIKDSLYSIRVKVLTVCQSRNADNMDDENEIVQEKEEQSYGSLMMERLTGNTGRFDYVLQDKTFRHPYISAIGSHTNYWRDCDTALFILKHLYRDIPEDPEDSNSHEECNGSNSKDKSGSTGWSDQREAIEEELPLTFADRSMTRNFSSKAKKFLKKG
ncbi:phospholipase SGR2 isoform X3 [Morus notabilis]|nr:phospholipase SGR2 isoform X3 [Morus notabilis]